jgi:hypothetical protein
MTILRPASRAAGLLLGACLLLLPACMKAKGEAVLAKDGSGTLTERATFDQVAMNQLIQMVGQLQGADPSAAGGEESQDPMMRAIMDAMSIDAIKKRYAGKTGVELLSVSRTDDLVKKTITVETKVKFASLDAYFRVGAGMLGRAAMLRLEQKDDVWTFSRRVHVEVMGMVINDEMSEETASQLEMLKMGAGDLMGGLEINLDLEVPGTVVETNGTKNAAGNVVSWTLGFNDLNNVKKMKQSVSFKGDGLALKPFHLRVGMDGRAEDVGDTVLVEKIKQPAPPAEPAKPDAPKPPAAPKPPETPKEPASPAAPR